MFKKYSFSKNSLFYHGLIRLAIPMAMTALLGSLLNMVDTFMISKLGGTAVAAVGTSNKVFFLMIVTLYGVYSGFGVFVSQYWGKKDIKRLQSVYMLALITGIFISVIITLLCLVIPKEILSLFSDDPEVLTLGVTYLRITSFTFIISAIGFSFEMVSRATEKVMLPFFVSGIGVIVNSLLNYVLIFGKLGFEEMGVEGAAIATLISRSLQLIIYLFYIFITKHPVLFIKIKNFVYEPQLFKKIYLKTIPVVGNEFFWALGIISIFAAYGQKGTDALASMQLFDTIVALLTVFTMGIANSSAIMIGKKIGEKKIDEAKWYAKLFLYNSVRFGFLTSLVLIAFIPLVPIIFNTQGEAIIYNIQNCLLVFAGYMPFNLLAATFIVGILRSGGDTKAAFIFEVSTLWGYAVPMAFLLVLFTPLSIPIIYLIITFELVIKVVFCYIRYKSGKYLHNLVH
ncbi:MATE family efflux transporter [Mycoplasmatota bacterium]|nr:MATE family efflux transporter [Mycoplasmatota bacterium]